MAESTPTNLLSLEVATTLGLALKANASQVQVPGALGELGVLPGHRPLLATVHPGLLTFTEKTSEGHNVAREVAIGSGFVEIGPNRVLALVDECAKLEDVNVAEAEADLKEANEKMAKYAGLTDDEQYKKFATDAEWAAARILLVRRA